MHSQLEFLHRALAGNHSYFCFGLIREEFVDRSSRARTTGIAVVVEEQFSPLFQPRIEELTGRSDGRVNVEIDVDKAKLPVVNRIKRLRNRSCDKIYICVTRQVSAN